MPEVPAVVQAEKPIVSVYQTAWERIQAEQQALVDNPLQARRRARLVEMRDTVGKILEEVDDETAKWVSQRLAGVYASGGAAGAAPMGAGEFLWTAISQEAVEELATNLLSDLLSATKHVNATTKTLVREIGRDAALKTAIDGRTAQAASKEMARLLSDHGVHAVTYANGAKHGLAEYSEMAIRTTTAKAYNYGVLNGSAQKGCEWWEVFDGPNCGWSAHDSGEQALGKIVSKEDAMEYPISHPNCRRTFGPRPDLTGPAAAEEGKGSVTPEQVAAQRAQDALRQEKQARRAVRNRQTQERRSARSPASRVQKRASRLKDDLSQADFSPDLEQFRDVKTSGMGRAGTLEEQHAAYADFVNAWRAPGAEAAGARGRAALKDYDGYGKKANTGPGPDFQFEHINGSARAGTPLDEIVTGKGKATAQDLQDAIDGSLVPEPVMVYRGGTFDRQFLDSLTPGSTMQDHGFMSTTLDRNRADAFKGSTSDNPFPDRVRFDIEVEQGAHGIPVRVEDPSPKGISRSDYEVLFGTNQPVEILETVWDEAATLRSRKIYKDDTINEWVVRGRIRRVGDASPDLKMSPIERLLEQGYEGSNDVLRALGIPNDGSPAAIQALTELAQAKQARRAAKEAARRPAARTTSTRPVRKAPTSTSATAKTVASVGDPNDLIGVGRAGRQATSPGHVPVHGGPRKKLTKKIKKDEIPNLDGVITEALEELRARYPNAWDDLEIRWVQEAHFTEKGVYFANGGLKPHIDFNGHRDLAGWNEAQQVAIEGGFHPPSVRAALGKQTAYHEFGHHLDWSLDPPFMQRAGTMGTQRTELRRRIKEFLDDGPGGGDDWLERHGARLRTEVSKYATTNDRELIAELFAEYASSPNPHPLARLVGEFFDEVHNAKVVR